MAFPFIQTAFSAGEIAPGLLGHVDLGKFHIGAGTMRNAFVSYRGGAYSRAGTRFVGFSKQTGTAFPPRLIPFQFSNIQGLVLEFGNEYMRVIKNGAYVLDSTTWTITNITRANPGVATLASGTGLSVGDWVVVSGLQGMTQLNGMTLVVASNSGGSATFKDVYGNVVSTVGFSAYVSGGLLQRIYTLTTPYNQADLGWLKWTQSADTMPICCWNQMSGSTYPLYDLVRLADNNWQLNAVTIGASIQPPGTVTSTARATTGTNPTSYAYVVTAVDGVTGQESIASAVTNITNSVDIGSTAGANEVDWTPVLGAGYYNTYKALPAYNGTTVETVPAGSLFGFMGTTYGTSMVDQNITPDFSTVPPLYDDPFSPGQVLFVNITHGGSNIATATLTAGFPSIGTGFSGYPVITNGVLTAFVITNGGQNYTASSTIQFTCTFTSGSDNPTATLTVGPLTGTYPSVPAYFQERLVYAGTPNQPDTYFMSQPGAFHNFDARIPSQADDAIVGSPWSVQVNGIQWMVPMPGGLVVLTGKEAWQLTGAGGSSLNPQPITPSSQQAQPQAFNGISSQVPPQKIDFDILYVQAKGSIVRDLAYNFFTNIYTGIDLTQYSSHLFTGYQIDEWAWAEEPYKVMWAVRDDGVLLSLTFLKQQEVTGWARHDTQGLYETVASVTELPVDAVYVGVQRYLTEGTAYTIERFDNRIWEAAEDCWCVDCGLQTGTTYPNATLKASSAAGSGGVFLISSEPGQNYSNETIATVIDYGVANPGTGAILQPVIHNGQVIGINVVAQGKGYTNPIVAIYDPGGTGSGASASVDVDRGVTLTASSAVFAAGNVGNVIRMGGGVMTITNYVSTTEVLATVTSPIVQIIPNGVGLPLPQTVGNWSMSSLTATVSGLQHLAGMMVTGLADGAVITPRLVSSNPATFGQVTLDLPASLITIGLAFQVQVQSVPADTGNPTIQGQRKKLAAVTARVEASRELKMGANQPDGSTLSPTQIAPIWTQMDLVPDLNPEQQFPAGPLYSGDVRIPLPGGFQKPGQVCMQQDYPLPMNILAFIPETLPGDIPELESGSGRRGQR